MSEDRDVNIGELVFETLLGYDIKSITDLNLNCNESWFMHPDTKVEISSNVDLLAELITKQTGLQHIHLSGNLDTSSRAT